MTTIHEPARETPVVFDCDLCVVGGSGTGVFAAARAAQRGLTVALVELNGIFGGVATAGLVHIWHSLLDTEYRQQIIGGLTLEVAERLRARGAATVETNNPHAGYVFNAQELVLELDALVRAYPTIRPFLHTRFVAPVVEEGRVTHVIIEDKTGRRAIKARYVIDATGDGDVLARVGLPTEKRPDLQPPTVCAVIHGLDRLRAAHPGFNLVDAIHDPKHPEALQRGFAWHFPVPGLPGATMLAGTRAHHADCSDADSLTVAELEGRRQVRAIMDILRREAAQPTDVTLGNIASYIGIRETRHAVCHYRLTETDVLEGVRFPDAIANGSYRVDVHHSDRAGLTFRYLDGREVYHEPLRPPVEGRWRPARAENPTFYQIPYRSLVPQGARNVLAAGRLVDADRGAYGAVRVMVNTNQTGEAAGLACALACETGCEVGQVDTAALRQELAAVGAVVI